MEPSPSRDDAEISADVVAPCADIFISSDRRQECARQVATINGLFPRPDCASRFQTNDLGCASLGPDFWAGYRRVAIRNRRSPSAAAGGAYGVRVFGQPPREVKLLMLDTRFAVKVYTRSLMISDSNWSDVGAQSVLSMGLKNKWDNRIIGGGIE